MKLTDYLQAWGDSLFKRNKTVIVQQLGLDYNRNVAIRNDVISSEDNISYTAPGDGVITSYLHDKTAINGVMTTIGSISLLNMGSLTGAATTAILAPVKKGENVTIFTKTFDNANRVVRFIPYIGGGLNSILESGGELCLRLKNTLARSLNSVAGKQCRQTRLFKWEHQKTESHLTTLHRAMGTSVCESLMRQTQHSPKSRLQRTEFCLSFQPTHLLERLAYQLKKVKLYQLSPDTMLRGKVPVSLFPPLAQPNLVIQGGAL